MRLKAKQHLYAEKQHLYMLLYSAKCQKLIKYSQRMTTPKHHPNRTQFWVMNKIRILNNASLVLIQVTKFKFSENEMNTQIN